MRCRIASAAVHSLAPVVASAPSFLSSTSCSFSFDGHSTPRAQICQPLASCIHHTPQQHPKLVY
ncbi:hypothetical protein PF003_g35896 [Phytophthora fragariae]|nr:hypothetical protein PF003_g35896 [Phytophthora fragariae]